MKNFFPILFLVFVISCQNENSALQDNVSFVLSTYEDSGVTKASAMPVLTATSKLIPYQKRFEYLLMNIPEIFQPGQFNARNDIHKLYPDTAEIKRLYMEKYCQDQKLVNYFEEMYAPIEDPEIERGKSYTVDELMEVASKFFYCDAVFPDTTVQMHICIGINGQKETKWDKDYTLLAAFCFEAIYTDLETDGSQIRNEYSSEKQASCDQLKPTITTLDKYLEDVKMDVFSRMKSNAVLKEKLLAHYELNKENLAFEIIY